MGKVKNKLLTSQITLSTMTANLFNSPYIFLISKQQKVVIFYGICTSYYSSLIRFCVMDFSKLKPTEYFQKVVI